MKLKHIGGFAASAFMFAAAVGGAAAQPATYTLRATVPASCWVRPTTGTSMVVVPGQPAVGRVVEACNSGGFRIVASYRPLLATERARLRYGESSVQLPQGGEALLRQSNQAEIREREFAFEDTQLESPLVIALAIAPL